MNLKDSYYSKLYYSLKADYLIKNIISYHFSDHSVDLKNYICQFVQIYISKDLYISIINEMHDLITSSNSD